MPFASQAQARFMYARHPDIAKRWTREFGGYKGLPEHVGGKGGTQHMNMKPSGTPSNESWQPATTRVPRIPGVKRDYGMLKPSASKRFIPKNSPHPNETEHSKEGPVEGLHGSNPPFRHLKTPTREKGFTGRDERVAFNLQAKRKGT